MSGDNFIKIDDGSILIIRLSAIGDIVMATPLVDALRASYPKSRITWLVQAGFEDCINQHPGLDEVIVWPRSQWKSLWRRFQWYCLFGKAYRFIRLLRAKNFSLVIDAQGLLKSGIWAWLSGARKRIGLGSKEGSSIFMTRVIEKPEDDNKIGSEYHYLIKELGLDQSRYNMKVGLAPGDEEFAKNFIKDNKLENGYVTICPFTTRPQKHWIDDNWTDLVDKIKSEYKLDTVMLGGPGDVTAAGNLERSCSSRIFNLVGMTRLRQAAALIERATILFGVDTGLSHMGTAFQIPTVVLFGSTCPYLETDSDKTRVLYKSLECSPCRRNPTCNGDYTCMKLITSGDVIDTARELLPGI